MYNSDEPIKDINEELLGQFYFDTQLSKDILAFAQNDSIVIRMFEKRGTGKTSIINMALNEIKIQTINKTYEERPMVFKFEPWSFSDIDNLIIQFFHCFRQNINFPENSKFKKKLEKHWKIVQILRTFQPIFLP